MTDARIEAPYGLADPLHLWLLTDPAQPVLVGELNLVRKPIGVSLRYAASWLARGFALSEDMPLASGEYFPDNKDCAAGAVDDARPDRWGERVIRVIDQPPRLSLLDYLYYAGDDRFGALGVSISAITYLPRRTGPLPTLNDAAAIQALVRQVLSGEPIAPAHRRLISPGATMGGARPKALLTIEGEPWIVKFSEGEPVDAPLIEHATMTLACMAGIQTATTMPIRLDDGHAVAVKRFDRSAAQRVHALSANVALKAAGDRLGYPELAQLLRRRGVAQGNLNVQQMHELFRRMVFNILIDNTDDHEKNHVLLLNAKQQFELSPAFDVLPSGQSLGFQQMRVGQDDADATLDNALSMSAHFALTPDAAANEVRRVIAVVETWREHFMRCGVSTHDVALLAQQIDRPFLRGQRTSFAA